MNTGALRQRILTALLVFVGMTALSLLLPASLPGEMASTAMTPHGPAICQQCPPTERIVAAGMLASPEGWHVNVQFAAPPFNARLRISLAGVPGDLTLQQNGTTWQSVAAQTPGAPIATTIAQRNAIVVVTLPASIGTTGVAVSTVSGDRIPDSGFAPPRYPAAPHFNAVDVVLLLVFAASAWFGYRRGLAPELGNLIAAGVSLAIAALAYRPIASLFANATASPRGDAALGSVLVIVVTSAVGMAVVPRAVKGLLGPAGAIDARVSRAGGLALAPLRQVIVVAMVLTLGTDLALLHWAAPSISESSIGAALLQVWHTLFAGT